MTEKRLLGSISAVTDCETGMYRIGEIEGGFNGLLDDHIRSYGSEGLLITLARFTSTVFETQRKINMEGQAGASASVTQ
mgnify:CR=1 FL=1